MSLPPLSRRHILVEILLIFAVFAIQGAWPTPDVNEPYYLGKAIHAWNPDWLRGDFFMDSPDTHKVFCFTFGWLSLWLPPVVLAWTGRILSWALLAWAWRRLSFAVVPRAWWSVLTAAMFGCLMERCQMAGEWVIGGVEAKPFAYVFVFLGIEALVRDRWNRGLMFFGAAAAFHVLVGGWAAVAAGVAWICSPRLTNLRSVPGEGQGVRATSSDQWSVASGQRETTSNPQSLIPNPSATSPHSNPLPRGEGTRRLRSLWLGILGGLLLSLPGLIPSLAIDWSVDRATAAAAHQIYVFERLPHHLTLTGIRTDFILRLLLLGEFWLLFGQWSRRTRWAEEQRQSVFRLRAFVTGAVAVTFVGVAINLLVFFDQTRPLAADLLRFYWFRLTDVMLPLGVALEGVALIVVALAARSKENSGKNNSRGPTARGAFSLILRGPLAPGYWALILAIFVAAFHVGDHVLDRLHPAAPRSHRIANFADWRAACRWVTDSGTIPPDARFSVPRDAQTFKWYTGRREVVNWKDVPQDAKTLLEWWCRVQDIYATGLPEGPRWHEPLATVGAERLGQLGMKYDAGYIITERTDPLLKLPVVYRNETYVIYRIK